MLVWTEATRGERRREGQAGRQGGRQADRARSSVVRGPWFVVKEKVGGNKGKLLSFHYARYQGPREAFINNQGS